MYLFAENLFPYISHISTKFEWWHWSIISNFKHKCLNPCRVNFWKRLNWPYIKASKRLPFTHFKKQPPKLLKFQNFTGKHLRWSLFLLKLQAWRSAISLKRGSNTGFFQWHLQNFKEQLFWRISANGCWLILLGPLF